MAAIVGTTEADAFEGARGAGRGVGGLPLGGTEDGRIAAGPGADAVRINGLGGADRLAVGEVFGTRLVATPGGTVEVKGLDSLFFNGGRGNDVLAGGAARMP